jgi:hypothetical protein
VSAAETAFDPAQALDPGLEAPLAVAGHAQAIAQPRL